jgi:hypothetical protein
MDQHGLIKHELHIAHLKRNDIYGEAVYASAKNIAVLFLFIIMD